MKYDRNTVKAWAGDSQWKAIRADLARFRVHGYSGWGSEGFWALAIYRLQVSIKNARPKWIWAPARAALAAFRKLLKLVTHISISLDAQVGPGLLIPHSGPISVLGGTKIGADCSLYQVCTIGAGFRPGGATIGDHVYIACHSSIIGPVVIGDGATIAPNSLVIDNVPAGATAIGVPARIVSPNPQVSPSSLARTSDIALNANPLDRTVQGIEDNGLNREAVMQRLEAIFRSVIDPGLVLTEEFEASTHPQWDSLKHIVLMVEIEMKLGVPLSNDELAHLRNVGEMVTLLQKKGVRI